MTRDATCAERIAEHQAGREDDVRALFDIMAGEDAAPDPDYPGELMTPDDAAERLGELPLGISVTRLLRIELSTGGPADYILAEIEEAGEVIRATYHFADWWDHAETVLDQDSPLWRLAEYYAELETGFAPTPAIARWDR